MEEKKKKIKTQPAPVREGEKKTKKTDKPNP